MIGTFFVTHTHTPLSNPGCPLWRHLRMFPATSGCRGHEKRWLNPLFVPLRCSWESRQGVKKKEKEPLFLPQCVLTQGGWTGVGWRATYTPPAIKSLEFVFPAQNPRRKREETSRLGGKCQEGIRRKKNLWEWRRLSEYYLQDAGGQSPYTLRKCNCGGFDNYRLLMTIKPL